MVFASIREHAEHCDFFASTSRNKKFALRACEQLQKFGEHEQASTCLNFASKSSNGKILRAVKNFNGPLLPKFSRVLVFAAPHSSCCFAVIPRRGMIVLQRIC